MERRDFLQLSVAAAGVGLGFKPVVKVSNVPATVETCLCAAAGVDERRLADGVLTEQEIARLHQAAESLASLPFYLGQRTSA